MGFLCMTGSAKQGWDSQVLRDLGHKDVALASMHSISKGFYGECGRRGGYTELVRLPLQDLGTSVAVSLGPCCD